MPDSFEDSFEPFDPLFFVLVPPCGADAPGLGLGGAVAPLTKLDKIEEAEDNSKGDDDAHVTRNVVL
eukprot:5677789-Pleurochrysis_carterae.AAC.1